MVAQGKEGQCNIIYPYFLDDHTYRTTVFFDEVKLSGETSVHFNRDGVHGATIGRSDISDEMLDYLLD